MRCSFGFLFQSTQKRGPGPAEKGRATHVMEHIAPSVGPNSWTLHARADLPVGVPFGFPLMPSQKKGTLIDTNAHMHIHMHINIHKQTNKSTN